jgi:hypothetical protein
LIWYWNSSALLLQDVDSIVWIVRKTIIRMVLTIAIRTARNWVLPYVQFMIELFSLSSSESSSVYFVQVFFSKRIHINALEFDKNIRLFTVLHEQYLDLSWVHVSAIKMSLWVLHFWASELSFCYPSNASLKLVENNVHGIKLL